MPRDSIGPPMPSRNGTLIEKVRDGYGAMDIRSPTGGQTFNLGFSAMLAKRR